MKAVAWTALVALIVSIPFLLRKRKLVKVEQGYRRATPNNEERLYDNEDFFA